MSILRFIKNKIFLTAARTESAMDQTLLKRRRKRSYKKPLQIHTYNGLGNKDMIFLKGRVVQDRNIRTPEESTNAWHNFVGMLKRLETNEIPGIQVSTNIDGNVHSALTDDEGYFYFKIPAPLAAAEDRLWYELKIYIDDDRIASHLSEETTVMVQIPSPKCDIGIISDIDDTVLQTNATSLWRMLKVTFLHNAHTRLPFKGVAAFYKALSKGTDPNFQRPLFFVSSSPWNIYDMLLDFSKHQNIPEASYFLRDIGIGPDKFLMSSHHEHKAKHLDLIFQVYADMKFILLGDSGQKDPEIFVDAVRRHPDRIAVIYIRDVTKARRDKEVKLLLKEALEHQVELVFVQDSFDAAKHAAEKGYIDKDFLTEILREKETG